MPTVLVTGASRGIGRVITLRLAAAGWDVHAGVRRLEDGEALQQEAAPGRVTPLVLDVVSAEDLAGLAARLPERLDALVNNAGIVVAGPVEALAADDVRRQLEVNVVGQIGVTQAVLPLLRESGGRIVFISSISGRVSTPFTGIYSASKFAIEAVADALRMELRPWKIPVILVEPGAIDTDMWSKADAEADAAEAAMTEAQRALYAPQLVGMRKTLKRIQKQTTPPEKVAAAVEQALTASRPRARYLVGLDARAQVGIRALLPTRLRDAAIAKVVTGS